MSGDFLKVLAERTLGVSPRLGPIVPSRYEDQRDMMDFEIEEERVVTESRAPARTAGDDREHTDGVEGTKLLRGDDDVFASRRAPRRSAEDAAPLLVRYEGDRSPEPASSRAGMVTLNAENRRDDPRAATSKARLVAAGPERIEVNLTTNPERPLVAALLRGEATSLAPLAQPPPGRVEQSRRESADQFAEPPMVLVRIGRIDVRANAAPKTPSAPAQPSRSVSTRPSLAEYLRARNEGRR